MLADAVAALDPAAVASALRDRRTVVVYPTQAGAQVFRDMADHRRAVLSRVLAELSEDEMAALLTGMKAILAARRRLTDANEDLVAVRGGAAHSSE